MQSYIVHLRKSKLQLEGRFLSELKTKQNDFPQTLIWELFCGFTAKNTVVGLVNSHAMLISLL